ncbi:unnamed protein product, partial [Prorocentrum cordatum]
DLEQLRAAIAERAPARGQLGMARQARHLGIAVTVDACWRCALSALLFVAQLEWVPAEARAQEEKAVERLVPGPPGWAPSAIPQALAEHGPTTELASPSASASAAAAWVLAWRTTGAAAIAFGRVPGGPWRSCTRRAMSIWQRWRGSGFPPSAGSRRLRIDEVADVELAAGRPLLRRGPTPTTSTRRGLGSGRRRRCPGLLSAPPWRMHARKKLDRRPLRWDPGHATAPRSWRTLGGCSAPAARLASPRPSSALPLTAGARRGASKGARHVSGLAVWQFAQCNVCRAFCRKRAELETLVGWGNEPGCSLKLPPLQGVAGVEKCAASMRPSSSLCAARRALASARAGSPLR